MSGYSFSITERKWSIRSDFILRTVSVTQFSGSRRIEIRFRDEVPVAFEFGEEPTRAAESGVEKVVVFRVPGSLAGLGAHGVQDSYALPVHDERIDDAKVFRVRVEFREYRPERLHGPSERFGVSGIHGIFRHQVERRLVETADDFIRIHAAFAGERLEKARRGDAAIHARASVGFDDAVEASGDAEGGLSERFDFRKVVGLGDLLNGFDVLLRIDDDGFSHGVELFATGGTAVEIAAFVERFEKRETVGEHEGKRFVRGTEFESRIHFRKELPNGIRHVARHARIVEVLVHSDGDGFEYRVIEALLPFAGFDVDFGSDKVLETEFGSVKRLPRFIGKVFGIGEYRVLGFVEPYRGHAPILPQRRETVKNRAERELKIGDTEIHSEHDIRHPYPRVLRRTRRKRRRSACQHARKGRAFRRADRL